MNLPKLTDLDVIGKRVFLRADLDVPLNEDVLERKTSYSLKDDSRLLAMKPTFVFLLKNKVSQIIIGGHLGRSGKGEPIISSKILLKRLSNLLGANVVFSPLPGYSSNFPKENIVLLENLRSTPLEEKNDSEFAKKLADLADLYVNECFSTSHRKHASIVALPKVMKSRNKLGNVAAGLRFMEEVKNLSGILEKPRRPVVSLISGIKKDKLDYINSFSKIADKVLVAGRLPEYLESDKLKVTSNKLVIAQLNPDKEDITVHSIVKFEQEIAKAGTIVLAGVIGKYEDEGQRLGTQRVFSAIANSSAYKVVGGGDSEAALTMFGLTDKFDWISVGGGAMLEFLAKGTLPGIEALV